MERMLVGLTQDRVTREEASEWASPIVANDHPPVQDFPAWEALSSIAMCDGKDLEGRYMFHKTDFRAWLKQLRESSNTAKD